MPRCRCSCATPTRCGSRRSASWAWSGFLLLVIAFGTGFVAGDRAHAAAPGPTGRWWPRWPGCWPRSWWRPAIDWMWELSDRRPGGRRGARDAGRARDRCRRRGAVGASAAGRRPCRLRGAGAQDRGRRRRAGGDPVRGGADAGPEPPRGKPGGRRTRRRRGGDRGRRRRARACSPGRPRRTSSSRCSRSRQGNLGEANRHIEDALERDRSDWSTWLVAARVQTKAGFIRRGAGACDRPSAEPQVPALRGPPGPHVQVLSQIEAGTPHTSAAPSAARRRHPRGGAARRCRPGRRGRAAAGDRDPGLRLHRRRTSTACEAAGARTVKLVFPWRRIAPDVTAGRLRPGEPRRPAL